MANSCEQRDFEEKAERTRGRAYLSTGYGQALVQRMRVFMCECCYVPSRLIKGKVKGIGVETDFRENLRTRHDS